MNNNSVKPQSNVKKDISALKESIVTTLVSNRVFQKEEIEKGCSSIQNLFAYERMSRFYQTITNLEKNFDSIMKRINEIAETKGIKVKQIQKKINSLKKILLEVNKVDKLEDAIKLVDSLETEIKIFYEDKKLKPLSKELNEEQRNNIELLKSQKKIITKLHNQYNSKFFFDESGIESIVERSPYFSMSGKFALKKGISHAIEKRLVDKFDGKDKVLQSIKDHAHMMKLFGLNIHLSTIIDQKDEAKSEADKAMIQNFSDFANGEDYKFMVEAFDKLIGDTSLVNFNKALMVALTEASILACEIKGIEFSKNNMIVDKNEPIKNTEDKEAKKQEFSQKMSEVMTLVEGFNNRFAQVFYLMHGFDLTQFIDAEVLKKLKENKDPVYDMIMGFKTITYTNNNVAKAYIPTIREQFEKFITDPDKKKLYEEAVSDYDKNAQNFRSVMMSNSQSIEDQATKILNNEFFILGTRSRSGYNPNNPPENGDSNKKVSDNQATAAPILQPKSQVDQLPKIELEKNVEMHFTDKMAKNPESPNSKKLPGKLKIDDKLASMGDQIISGLNSPKGTPRGKTPKNK